MKAKIFLFGVGAIALLSGCFSNPEIPADGAVPENPAAKFDELTQKSRDAWAEEIVGQFPDFLNLQKYSTDASINGEVQIPNIGGAVNIALSAKGENDLTDPKNIKGKVDLSFSTEVSGAVAGKANLNASLILVDKSLFVSLADLTVDFPMIPASQIVEPLKPIFGKWYGDSFEKIDEGAKGLNIASALSQTKTPAQMREELVNIIKTRKILVMKSAEPVLGGQYVFNVELDKEELKGAILDFISIGAVPASEKDQIAADISKTLESIDVSGTLSLSAANPKNFRFDGKLINTEGEKKSTVNISLVVGENKKTLSAKDVDSGEHLLLSLKNENGKDTFEFSGGNTTEENQTALSGSKTKDTFNMTLFEPRSGNEIVVISLKKTGKVWNGTVNIAKASTTIEISNLKIGESQFGFNAVIKEGEKEIGKGDISYVITAKDNIQISAPESFEPLENLKPIFKKIFGGMIAPAPTKTPEETTEVPASMSDEEVQELLKNANTNKNPVSPPETPKS